MATSTETYRSGTESVPIDVFLPKLTGPKASVLIVHGSSGLGAQFRGDIVSFAEALAESGIAAALPHYFVAAKLRADADGLPLIGVHYNTWKTACADALLFMARDPRLDRSRLGVLGFSLGAHYALGLAMEPPAPASVKCVVDFFGPTQSPPLAGPWVKMPPLLVHHGLDDRLVEPSQSDFLKRQLEAVGKKDGKDFRIEHYKGQGHGFTGGALSGSRATTVKFFSDTL